MDSQDTQIGAAAKLLVKGNPLLIAAGSGLEIDSGLPDLRCEHDFWKTYPGLEKHGLRLEDVACPSAFVERPDIAWGFYGHRLNTSRTTAPTESVRLLLDVVDSLTQGRISTCIFTSNVDASFQRVGFNNVCEVHGSLHYLQCTGRCSDEVWSADNVLPVVDEANCRLVSELPRCHRCGSVARPNVLMFEDWEWLASRLQTQLGAARRRTGGWKNLVVLDVGNHLDGNLLIDLRESFDAPVIRISSPDASVSTPGDIHIQLDSIDALQRLFCALNLFGPIWPAHNRRYA